jgi:hypothetical protein
MNATRSASNALKHGLTSRTFVPDHARPFVDQFRQELVAIHDPKSAEESRLVAELAVALWQNYEHDRIFFERQAYEETIADQIFATQAQESLEETLSLLRTSPMLGQLRLAVSHLGSAHVKCLYDDAIATLSQEIPLSFQQITCCINAQGLDWRLDTLSAQAGLLMGLHMALVDDPETEIQHWVAESQPLSEKRADSAARHYHAHAPQAQLARQELLARLTDQRAQVAARLDTLHQQNETRRRLFKSANAGYGLDDPRATRSAMLAQRYRTAAFNRSVRIEKELKSLQAECQNNAPASIHTFRLPRAATTPVHPQTPANKHVASIAEPPSPAPSSPLPNEHATTPAHPFQPLFQAKSATQFISQPNPNRKARRAHLRKQAVQAK